MLGVRFVAVAAPLVLATRRSSGGAAVERLRPRCGNRSGALGSLEMLRFRVGLQMPPLRSSPHAISRATAAYRDAAYPRVVSIGDLIFAQTRRNW